MRFYDQESTPKRYEIAGNPPKLAEIVWCMDKRNFSDMLNTNHPLKFSTKSKFFRSPTFSSIFNKQKHITYWNQQVFLLLCFTLFFAAPGNHGPGPLCISKAKYFIQHFPQEIRKPSGGSVERLQNHGIPRFFVGFLKGGVFKGEGVTAEN